MKLKFLLLILISFLFIFTFGLFYGCLILFSIASVGIFLPKFILLPMLRFVPKRVIFRLPKTVTDAKKKVVALTFDDLPYCGGESFRESLNLLNKYGNTEKENCFLKLYIY